MAFQITAIYAAIFTILFIVLSAMVSQRRAAINVSIFDAGDEILGVRMRRHGNFSEVVPFVLILMALCEAQGADPLWLYILGSLTVLGRVLHALGLVADKPAHPLRIGGGMATQIPMLIAAGYLVANYFA